MKRKRGHKKGNKSKGFGLVTSQGALNEVTADDVSQNSENYSGEDETGNNETESRMEIDTPSSTGTDQPLNVAMNTDGSQEKAMGKSVGRVKVKLKTARLLESDVASPSDTDKSSPQMGLGRQTVAAEKIRDSANSLPPKKAVFLGHVYKKSGIKIKSSKWMGGSSAYKNSDTVMVDGDKSSDAVMVNANKNSDGGIVKDETSLRKEPRTPCQTVQPNKQELQSSLTVIKKVMKMDAAEPFNVPVNPEALGIPDYFEVIDTPMDFGTICSNLENGNKYKNSENVYRDVQFIWDNCSKYNKKGDYIVDLMKRVKKNFMKYWTASGLYTEQQRGGDSSQMDDVAQSSQGKMHLKGSQAKSKSQKRHGRRHKSDCLCAICILKRRKREREETLRPTQGQGVVQEGFSPVNTPSGEDSSLNMGEFVDLDADVGAEDKVEEVKLATEQPFGTAAQMQQEGEEEDEDEEGEGDEEEEEEEEEEGEGEEDNETYVEKKGEVDIKDKSQLGDESTRRRKLDELVSSHTHQAETSAEHQEGAAEVQQQKQKEEESQKRQRRSKMHENFQYENPMLANLCGILFPEKGKSVWNGPHSLFQRQSSGRTKTSSLHSAIESLMK